ncbi:hypothetical protein Tco_0705924 [Tanacetum coccineum]|uniref:Uncharacterized protein n=1 Tax=Tanacetum coccineum TaxID=301880 RepID=A0ABQ4Y802_9ASTR
MVISSPCLIDNKELTSLEQTAPGKDSSNPLIVDSLLKTIWSSMHHVFTMKHSLVQKQTGYERSQMFVSHLSNNFGGLLKLLLLKMEKSRYYSSMMATSMLITEGSLRRHLKLDDQDGLSSIPNSEIFEQLALMGYHTDSDKLTFQKGAFSPQWRFLIHSILHCH